MAAILSRPQYVKRQAIIYTMVSLIIDRGG